MWKIRKDLKNSSIPNSSNHEKKMEHHKYNHKVSFKSKDKSILDDSELIENYYDSLKSPQSRRLYKTLEN